MTNRTLRPLVERIGDKLLFAHYITHSFEGSINGLISCQLTFQSGCITFRNGSDGETLILEENLVHEADLGEYGRINAISSKEYDPAGTQACIGRHLIRYRVLTRPSGCPEAIELDFEGVTIGFYNCGDELGVLGSIASISGLGREDLLEWRTE